MGGSSPHRPDPANDPLVASDLMAHGRPRIRVSILVMIAMGLVGCAGSETSSIPSTTEGTTTTVAVVTTTTTVATTTSTERVPPPTYEVSAGDYFFDGIPESVPFGTRLELVNVSESEFHTLELFFLGGDETPLEDLQQMSLFELRQLFDVSSVVFSLPGRQAYGQLTGPGWTPPILNRPGRWIVVCSIPVGADPSFVAENIEANPIPVPEGGRHHYQEGQIVDVFVGNP